MRRPNRHRKKTLVDAATSDEEDDVDVKIFRNHVYLWSDITKKSSLDLILGLQKLHCSARSSTFRDDDSPIYIHINSNGGDVDAALGVADTMDNMVSNGANIVTIVEGTAASAATLISCAGTTRRIRPNATMRIHNFSTIVVGKKNDIDEEFENLNKLEEKLVKFYKDRTNMNAAQIKKLFGTEKDLAPKECIKIGLVDAIQS